MPHTYTTNLVHCVFSTKERLNLIPMDQQERLLAYMFGIAKHLNVEILALGGTANHIQHLIGVAREEFALVDCSRSQGELVALAVRKAGSILMARRFWCLQSKSVTSTCRQAIHSQSGRASPEEELRSGVSASLAKIRR